MRITPETASELENLALVTTSSVLQFTPNDEIRRLLTTARELAKTMNGLPQMAIEILTAELTYRQVEE